MTSSLRQPPSHVTLQPAVRRTQGRWSGEARPRLPLPKPNHPPRPPTTHLRDHHPSVPPSPLYLSRFPGKPELVRFWFPREARERQTAQNRNRTFAPSGFRCYSPEFPVEPPRRRCRNRAKRRQQQAQKCSHRPGVLEPTPSLSETGARLVGEGGTLNRQAGPRDRLHGARRRSRGRKNPLQGAGGGGVVLLL